MGALGKVIDAIKEAIQAVIDFVYGLYIAVTQWFISNVLEPFTDQLQVIVAYFWEAIEQLAGAIWAWSRDALGQFYEQIYELIIPWATELWDWVAIQLGLIRDHWTQWIKDNGYWPRVEEMQNTMAGLADAYADAAWLLPLNQCLGAFAATVVIIAAIRVGRWILSFLWITG